MYRFIYRTDGSILSCLPIVQWRHQPHKERLVLGKNQQVFGLQPAFLAI